MTQITPKQDALTQIASLLKENKGVEADTGQTSIFSDILAERLGESLSQTDEGIDASGGLPEIEATNYTANLSQISNTSFADLAQDITKALDQLDTYAQWLADPEKTLRQADTLLGQINDGVQDLLARAESESDNGLQDILTHLSTLVTVEKIKMDRGDYV